MERMLPRTYIYPHTDGPPSHLFQHMVPPNVSQKQRFEAHLNSANTFIGPPMDVPHFITNYQWTPVELSDVSSSPTGPMGPIGTMGPTGTMGLMGPMGINRKRRIEDNESANELKRQCFSFPSPHNQPARNDDFMPQPPTPLPTRPVSGREVTCPTCSSATYIPGGCVPSLGETCHQNAFSSSSVKDKLSQQILNLFYACEQQSDDLEKKESCRARLQNDIQKIFPCAQVFLGGSSLNGFGSRSSDADLCLIIKEGPVNHRKDAVYVLTLVRKLLYKLSYIEKPQLIRAKVPILKFKGRTSGVEFDLNFNNTVGIRNTFLLRTYAFVEKRVRPLILVIKKWASHHCINDASRGTLSSYTLVLMVLHYLQTLPEPVIPCLQRDYPSCFDPKMDVQRVPSGPSDIPAFVSKNHSSLGDLLLGFLRYYATVFKWDKHVISVRMAKILPKSNCKEWRDKFICVEEPFNRTNTARAVHERVKFEAIKAEFIESYRLLQLRKDLHVILPIRKRKTTQMARSQMASR